MPINKNSLHSWISRLMINFLKNYFLILLIIRWLVEASSQFHLN
jgi:hypothetical protein